MKINHYIRDATKVIWVKLTRRTEEVDPVKYLGRLQSGEGAMLGDGKEC